MSDVTRPVLRWHGGKWRLAPWVIAHLPPHRIYVEPFGGAASVLLRKPRSYAEVYNDLDSDVVGLFRVLREPLQARCLIELLKLTPFSREEFLAAYEPADDPVERARRLVARSFMAFGTTGRRKNATGFRAKAYRENQTGAGDFVTHPDTLSAVVERMRGVTIEHKPAIAVMTAQDTPETLHYCDPPYMHATRTAQAKWANDRAYAVEMSDEEHVALLEALKRLTGMVVLSGYPSALYDAALSGWRRVEKAALADGAKKRVEVLWINPRASAALDRISTPMLPGFDPSSRAAPQVRRDHSPDAGTMIPASKATPQGRPAARALCADPTERTRGRTGKDA